MYLFSKYKIKNSQKGITLIEVVVVVFLISLSSSILISDFPKIQKQYMLSRTAYKLAQDLRKAEDLALSGYSPSGVSWSTIVTSGTYGSNDLGYGSNDIWTKIEDVWSHNRGTYGGYGVYFDLYSSKKEYKIYIDSVQPFDSKYTSGDTIIETISISDFSSGVYIKEIDRGSLSRASINFSPPNPLVTITRDQWKQSNIEITLALDSDASITKTIVVNTSGLIEIK